MVKSIDDVIRTRRYFVGRQSELETMEDLLLTGKDEWSMVHFHGSAGMGKTVLLKQFAERHPHVPILYVDGHEGFDSKVDFLSCVRLQLHAHRMLAANGREGSASDVAASLAEAAERIPTMALLLDALDRSPSLHRWLKDEFLPRIRANVRVISTGRMPLDSWQTDFGWETALRNLPMKPLSRSEWTEYAVACGITDERLHYPIGMISQGIPLAVSMTCGWIAAHRIRDQLHESDHRRLTAWVRQRLLAEGNLDGVDKTLLELASLVYIFDQEILEYMLGHPIAEAEFSRLCQSSFVEPHASGGWMVGSGIRRLARAGFRERLPGRYEQYKQKAEEILKRRFERCSDQEEARSAELAMGKFVLQDHEYIHGLVYYGDKQNFRVRAAHDEDLPMLADMYRTIIRTSPPYRIDDSHQEQYLQAIRRIDPTAIRMIEHNGQCLFFYAQMPINGPSRSLLLSNPATRRWIGGFADAGPHDWLYWMFSSYPSADWEVMGYFLHQLFLPSLRGRRVTCQLWTRSQVEVLQLLGFRLLAEVGYVTPGGMHYDFCQLDARGLAVRKPSAAAYMEEELPAWRNLAKQVLSQYSNLEYDKELLAQCRMRWATEQDDEALIERIRGMVHRHMQRLKEGSKLEKQQAQILQYAYLQRFGSHESVALRLDIPSSTYYRQLKKLIDGIARLLQTQVKT